MKKRYIVSGLFLAVVIVMLVSAIRTGVERHRRTRDMAILQRIGLKLSAWSMDSGETSPSLTNKSFLGTLAPDESAFLKENRVSIPSGSNDFVAMQVETGNGEFALCVDGSVQLLNRDGATRSSLPLQPKRKDEM